ncbi:hydrogenase maturation protease [Streptomyces oryzae]|uniref:hydrogenase maturation protease n=1 Tax=Streptomyces oryzae TaxID=1434886 RepID=UPI0027DE629D|nr:hydrogenase maturation protease [Streptomyces oryzae]
MSPPHVSSRIVVIGIGNIHRRDDGVGPAVITRLTRQVEEGTLSASVGLHVSDGEPARLLALWESADLGVVVDAARNSPPAPGRVHRLEADGLVLPPAADASSHGLGLGDALRLAHALDRLPRRLVVYGVEAADTGFGTGLTPRIAEAVGPLTERVVEELCDPRFRARPGRDGESASTCLSADHGGV